MAEEAIKIGGKKKSMFLDKVKELLPEGGNLNLCLTCGACSSGCPATGLEDMDPRKFLHPYPGLPFAETFWDPCPPDPSPGILMSRRRRSGKD